MSEEKWINLIEDFYCGAKLKLRSFLFANVCLSSILFTSSKATVHIENRQTVHTEQSFR